MALFNSIVVESATNYVFKIRIEWAWFNPLVVDTDGYKN
jgi:hypothetical protein